MKNCSDCISLHQVQVTWGQEFGILELKPASRESDQCPHLTCGRCHSHPGLTSPPGRSSGLLVWARRLPIAPAAPAAGAVRCFPPPAREDFSERATGRPELLQQDSSCTDQKTELQANCHPGPERTAAGQISLVSLSTECFQVLLLLTLQRRRPSPAPQCQLTGATGWVLWCRQGPGARLLGFPGVSKP